MKVVFINQRKEIEVAGCKRLKNLLDRLKINPESVLVIRDGNLITSDTHLSEDETIEILPVISGGI